LRGNSFIKCFLDPVTMIFPERSPGLTSP
jgi:hypothetical protein